MRKTETFSGLSLNILKIIAMISMVIDHIGVYFVSLIPNNIYIIFRLIGRMAMPLFVFSLVQGYLHTRNLRNYILRISIVAVITQLCIYLISIVNKIYFTNYSTYMADFLNILFSFALSLIFIKAIDFTKKYVENVNKYINFILRVLTIFLVITTYIFIDIDYRYIVLILSVNFFIFEKLKQSFKNETKNLIYTSLEALIMLSVVSFYNIIECFCIFDVILVFLYNGKKKNKYDLSKKFSYSFFPVHHSILYVLAMILGG